IAVDFQWDHLHLRAVAIAVGNRTEHRACFIAGPGYDVGALGGRRPEDGRVPLRNGVGERLSIEFSRSEIDAAGAHLLDSRPARQVRRHAAARPAASHVGLIGTLSLAGSRRRYES